MPYGLRYPNCLCMTSKNYSGHHQSILATLSESGAHLPTLDILDLIEFCWKSVGAAQEDR